MSEHDVIRILGYPQIKKRLKEAAFLVANWAWQQVDYYGVTDRVEATRAASNVHPAALAMVRRRFDELVRSGLSDEPPADEPPTVLRKQILDKLERPQSLHIDDLCDAFAANLLVEDEEFDCAYAVFVAHVAEFLERKSRQFPVERNQKAGPLNSAGLGRAPVFSIFSHELQDRDCVEFEWVASSRVVLRVGPIDEGDLVATLSGEMTDRAALAMESELRPILGSLIALLCLPPGAQTDDVQIDAFEETKDVLAKALDAIYAGSRKKDNWDTRVRNAVLLLVASDESSNLAVKFALLVTVLEALLGSGGEGITHRLAQNVSVLLEPVLERRKSAEKFVEDLYKLRCSVLYGSGLDVNISDYHNARWVLAAALASIPQALSFLQRLNDPERSPRDFLKELDRTQFKQGLPPGVLGSGVRSLWMSNDTE